MKSLVDAFNAGLQKTKTRLWRGIESAYSGNTAWSEELYEELEAALIGADLGVNIATRIVEEIRDRYERGQIKTADDIVRVAQADIGKAMAQVYAPFELREDGPTVVLLVGVNGSGKTTTAGKLAWRYQKDGKRAMLAACDTFRAAAIDQLKIWGERVDCPVVAGQPKTDAAAVAFDAVKSAQAKDTDLLLIDTAGRQHTRKNLMEELAKIKRAVARALPGAPHETWLVVDGSSGSNAMAQAREFDKIIELSGIVLTKIDGTPKGGIVVAIHEELDLPVRFLGLGESPEDLLPFSPQVFSAALFYG